MANPYVTESMDRSAMAVGYENGFYNGAVAQYNHDFKIMNSLRKDNRILYGCVWVEYLCLLGYMAVDMYQDGVFDDIHDAAVKKKQQVKDWFHRKKTGF